MLNKNTDGSDADGEMDEELLTNIIPTDTNTSNTDLENNNKHKDTPSNIIDNNTEMPEQNQMDHVLDSHARSNNIDEEININDHDYTMLNNNEEIAADKPIAMMLTSRRKPLAYSGLNFGIFAIVKHVFV